MFRGSSAEKKIEVANSAGALVAGDDLFLQSISVHIENLKVCDGSTTLLAENLSKILEWLTEYHEHCRAKELENVALRSQNEKLKKCLSVFIEEQS